MNFNVINKVFLTGIKNVLIGALFTLVMSTSSFPGTVKVFNGRGLIGVYGEYSTSVSGTSMSPASGIGDSFGYIQLYNFNNGLINYCTEEYGRTATIDGITGMPINNGEMILVPEFMFVDDRSFQINNVSMRDRIVGHFNGWGSGTNEQLGKGECLWAPLQSSMGGSMYHRVSTTGRLLIYGTGKQKSGWYNLRDDIGISVRNPRMGASTSPLVLKTENINIIVSGLTCTLNTPAYINFGAQSASGQRDERLSEVKNTLSVRCDQNNTKIGATIALSANVKPQYFSGNELQVNLLNAQNKPGAYVKMYVMVNGSKTPITLNQVPIDLAKITSQEQSVSFSNEIIYELYSRGNNITGKVSGSAELSIIMR